MADDDTETTAADSTDLSSFEDRLKAIEDANKAMILADMDRLRQPLAATLPTQAAPMAPPRNNIYMGPNIASPDASPQQFFRDNPFLQGTHSFITPPEPSPEAAARVAYATGGESDQSRLARLQAADQPGTFTTGTQTEDPYSDASVANQRNQMIYGAMKAYQGGDRSPENVALLMSQTAMPGGRYSPYSWGMTPAQQAANAIAQRRLAIAQDQGAQRATTASEREARLSAASASKLTPAENDKVDSINKEIAAERLLSKDSTKLEDINRHEANITYLEQMKQGIFKKAGPLSATPAPTGTIPPVQAPATAPVPVPKSKADLVSGRRYQTSKGILTWDGSKFVR